MKDIALLGFWSAAIVGISWAGAWKVGEGGGWLIFLAFLMLASFSYNSEGK